MATVMALDGWYCQDREAVAGDPLGDHLVRGKQPFRDHRQEVGG
jgi:hypothetical protein